MRDTQIGWAGILRLGLVQTALGAIVVLTTSTMNRVMVVELALPAMLPGLLVGIHYLVQMLRPRLGHGSDVGGRRTPWIVGGMAVLALGGILAAIATAWMGSNLPAGVLLAVLAFALIGAGVGAAGTSLLVLLAKRVDATRRAPAATIVWIMMIAGFALTAGIAGSFLDPFTPLRLVVVTCVVSALAFALTVLAVRNVEGPAAAGVPGATRAAQKRGAFRAALAQAWADAQARRFTIFVFVSMLAYSLQDLILEPFAGAVFGFTPGESTKLAGLQHTGVMLGMITVALAGSAMARGRFGSLRAWMIGGCVISAFALFGLALGGTLGSAWPLRQTVFVLGLGNGAFAVAAIGSMMALASDGGGSREGIRMGLWGAAQAIAFGLGGFLGTLAADLARHLLGSAVTAYASVFTLEGMLFLLSAVLACGVSNAMRDVRRARMGVTAAPYAARAEGG
jgi:BCD family chlorophyll transporter-like MFS transporter